jgi:serine/threonine protein kinase
MLATDTKLDRYEIRSKLGAGVMGEVYRARDSREFDPSEHKVAVRRR